MAEETACGADGRGIDGEMVVVLVNAEGQHSLWPAAKAAPQGWSRVFGPAARAEGLAWVEANWTDARPLSLGRAMTADRG